jgi:predicted acylesterase/phospholipase RssA
LAFQGGGAKGFAYVGAYKAIKEKKEIKKNKDIEEIEEFK